MNDRSKKAHNSTAKNNCVQIGVWSNALPISDNFLIFLFNNILIYPETKTPAKADKSKTNLMWSANITFPFLVGVVDIHMLYTLLIIDFGWFYVYSNNYAMFDCVLQVFLLQTCTDQSRVFWEKVDSKLRPHTPTAAFWLNLKE